MHFRQRIVITIASIVGLAVHSNVRAEEATAPMERSALVAEALRSHPAIRAAEQRASAVRRLGDAEGSLPAPEAMTQIWQVPIARPYAVNDAQMIMFGVGQKFPAVGARDARRRAADHDAEAELAASSDVARQVRREVSHAFADYVEASARHRVHREHRALVQRTLDVAAARHAAGGSLSDVAQAEVELARTDADVVTDGTRIEAARSRLNALVGRPLLSPMAPPASGAPETSAWDAATALAKARETRPELRASSERREARREEARAAEREATIPSFGVAVLYFAPTSPMPEHGYGVNASMTLPWLWGEASARRDARREAAVAAETDVLAARRPVDAEIASAEANVRGATLRLQTLEGRALPAGRRALDVARSGYETGGTAMLVVLSLQRSVVEVEMDVIAARAMLDHALADLDAAVGAEVPRIAVAAAAAHEGNGHE
jgi:outer membrane protein TolC